MKKLSTTELLTISGGSWSGVGACTVFATGAGTVVGGFLGGNFLAGGLLGSHYGAAACIAAKNLF